MRERISNRQERVTEVIEENERRERHNTRLSIIEEQQTDFEDQHKELSAELDKANTKFANVDILKKSFDYTKYKFKSKKDLYLISFFILLTKKLLLVPNIYALKFLQLFLDNNNLSPFLA